LFKWIPGKTLDNYITTDNYYKFGATMAKMHNHSAKLKLPKYVQPKKWDKVFYYPDEPVVYDKPEHKKHFTPKRMALMNKAIKRCDRLLKKLYLNENDLMLIHGDLHFWNVHLHKGEFYIIDFEDIMLGYPVQDIAVTLSYGLTFENYNDLKAAFREGYSSVRKWPKNSEKTISTLQAARSVMFINYVARIFDDPKDYLKIRFKRLEKELGE